ncbi:GntR family transcriptional regulator [Mageeibacillus indolicus]|jgi:hypothetical protein|uniref:Transcriptional regulator, GntR family n=2 Tax=Mageeibacillus indolicus TaxID=884684 RepID=D3R2P2_MAGIU|nr:GntR family transcriptional regulator [Mageeibacillus indolicus]ADC90514.1 transcriptional regulator, GntR family [Mageeibacillus indolicus UPII9-5]KFA57340.1 hypothetical protein HMPREF1632_04100 [Mageeibacillus indolicus 0009-5]PNH19927.1 hypothetical protein B7R76_03390 [Mageeibacillus indolicus]
MEKLDKRSSVPLYAQLKELLQRRIADAVYSPGEKIPTELKLCEELDLSRPTVRQAVAELVAEGKLYIIKGRGTFVTATPELQVIRNYNSMAFSAFRPPLTGTRHFIDYRHLKRISVDVTAGFGKNTTILQQGVYEIIWLDESEEGKPLVYGKAYIPAVIYPNLLSRLTSDKESKSAVLWDVRSVGTKAQAVLAVRPALTDEARYLDITKAFPVLTHNAKIYNRTGAVCELVEAIMPTDRCALMLDLINMNN